MKVAIYSPYLDSCGGGERYILTIAEILAAEHQVEILLDPHLMSLGVDLKLKLSKQLNIDLSKCRLVAAPIGRGSKIWQRWSFFKQYDLLISLTDGSIFYASAKKNLLHIQSPIKPPKLNSWWNQIKLKSWNMIIYNSQFTQNAAQDYWRLPGKVLYPPVEIDQLKPMFKKKQILTVGRFFGFLREKKHQVLIDSFKILAADARAKGWTFHLVGSASEGDMNYVKELEKSSEGYPIEIHPNLSYPELINLYGSASIYWHAMGYNETDPTKMEHFGITTVEAMAAGAVPMVVNQGGLPEIVEDQKSGLFWRHTPELIEKTLELISDSVKLHQLSTEAINRSKLYSRQNFERNLKELINEV